MKWTKHDSDANTDSKLKKVRHKYGLAGYGLYWYCIELIAGKVSIENLSFELEEDAELIALEWGHDQLKIQEMMLYMVDVKLFDVSDSGRVRCLKMAQRIDKSMTSNPQMRVLIEQIKENLSLMENHALSCEVMTMSADNMQDKNRLDKTKKEKKKGDFDVDMCFSDFWSDYPVKVGKAAAKTKFKAKCKNHKTFLAIINGLIEYNNLWSMIGKTDAFIANPPHPTTWLNQERWNDEIVVPSETISKSHRSMHGDELCNYANSIGVYTVGKTEFEVYDAIDKKLAKMGDNK